MKPSEDYKTTLHIMVVRPITLTGLRLRLAVRLFFLVSLLIPRGYKLTARLDSEDTAEHRDRIPNFEAVA